MCLQGQQCSLLKEEDYAMKTWYDKLFWKKKQLNHLNVYLGKNFIINTHRNLVKVSVLHRGMMYLLPLGAKKAISGLAVPSDTPLPLSADFSGSLDLGMNKQLSYWDGKASSNFLPFLSYLFCTTSGVQEKWLD